MDFSQSNCGACRMGAPTVTPEEYAVLIQEVPMWVSITIDGVQQLQRNYTFKNFAQALAKALAFDSESLPSASE